MNLTPELWKKVLKIRDSYIVNNSILSRRSIEKELSKECNSLDARLIYEILTNLPVILKSSGALEEAKLTDKVSTLARKNKELLSEVIRLNKLLDLSNEISQTVISPTSLDYTPKKTNRVTACTILSDTHFDEVVNSAELNNINEYNRDIATDRLNKYFTSLVKLRSKYFSNVEIESLVLMLAGDMVSGIIHDELKETNEFAITDTLVYYVEVICSGIKLLADIYGTITVPCVVGNHGRLTPKVKYKGSVKDNFDYLFYCMLKTTLKDDKRVTFSISDSTDCLIQIYGTRFLLTHGNDFRGGNGWGGPAMPVMRGDMRKRVTYNAVNLPYDVLCTAHFHTMKFLGDQIMSGCFPADARVNTLSGFSDIKNINIGDNVISGDGSVQKVTNKRTILSENGLVHLKICGICRPLTATPNHQVYAIKGESTHSSFVGSKWMSLRGFGDHPQWIPIDYISPGDYVNIPIIQGTNEPISEDLAWAFGLYVAEGWSTVDGGDKGYHNKIELTMHDNELFVLEKFAQILEDELDMGGYKVFTRIKRSGSRTSEYRRSGKLQAKMFREMFGHLAWNKRLPEWMMNMSQRLKRAFIQGWIDGDGHTAYREDGYNQTSATTTSEILAYQLFNIALGAGLYPSLSVLGKGGRRKRDSYTIHFNVGQEVLVIDEKVFYRVGARFRDRRVVPVYDLEVTGEHTFCVENCCVHNSLIGYNEFALRNGCKYEPPQLPFWLVHPNYGVTITAPVHCE